MTDLPSNVVLYDAAQLQDLLRQGKVTSVQLVDLFVKQIERHNKTGKTVNAVISTAPQDQLLARARALDTERREGKLRGSLHGIPVLVKVVRPKEYYVHLPDAIVTGPELGMPTTVGSWAISTLKSRKNAPIIDQLMSAGCIILAKTNLTEFCGLKSNDTDVGWSAFGGQTNSPYRRDDLADKDQPLPGGSSSGSAVGIITGFAPMSIGTETSGSTVYPAGLNGLYAMKLGHNKAHTEGVFKLSTPFDGLGVLARTPVDVAVLAEAIMTSEALAQFPYSLSSFVSTKASKKLNIGLVPIKWGMPKESVEDRWDLPQVVARYEDIVTRFRENSDKVTYPFETAEADTLTHGGNDLTKVAYYEFPSLTKEFLGNFEGDDGLTSLEDVVAWNDEHAEKALPAPRTGQTELIASLKSQMTPEVRDETVPELQRLADEEGMGKAMDAQGLDVVVSTAESTLIVFAACAGWPVAACPLGNHEKNGQPYGVFATARSEDTLCRFMGKWHRLMPGSRAPDVSTK
ncbi:amidase-like protein [Sarocladium strictum]